MSEVFKEIDGYGGLYLIDNCGTVLSTEFRNNIAVKKRIKSIKATGNGNGYMIVFLNRGGKRDRRYVHRLVAEAFVERVVGKNYVNHKDRNRANNRADNLEWCTQKENVRYSAEFMRHPKEKCRRTSTGYKYITLHNTHGRQKYRVQIQWRRSTDITREFYELKDAIAFRDGILNETIKT